MFASLVGCTAPNPEFPDAGTCKLGDRQCGAPRDRAVALVCGRDETDAVTFLEELCPVSAQCDGGRCVPDASATPCKRQGDCKSGESCAPLVANGALGSFCAPSQPAALAAAGAACTKDSDCQSYHCLQHQRGRFCLLACSSPSDCPLPATCQTLNVTITGVQGTVGSCSQP